MQAIGQILLGLLVGPSVLGLIAHTVLAQHAAALGAIVLLFLIGLEFKLKDIFIFRYAVIALGGVIVPWIGGYLTAKSFGYDFPSAVFTGTALTATSIAITASVLKTMGKLHTDAAKAIIGAAVMDDVLGLLALSFSKQIVDGTFSTTAIILVAVKALLFVAAGIYLGKKVLSPLIERLDRTPVIFIAVMAAAFLYVWGAETVHLSGVVGAFIAGISLGEALAHRARSHGRGTELLHLIFGAVFFVSLGVLVDLHAVKAGILPFLAALTAVAIATKFAGCFLAAKTQGFSVQDSAIIGFGMAPRGEVAMIVGLIGLNQNLITQEIYAAVIVMSLATTLLTPLVLRRLL